MAKGWRSLLDEENTHHRDSLSQVERIGKQKRSQRARMTDDWWLEEKHLLQKKSSFFCYQNRDNLRLGRVIEVHKRGIFVAEEELSSNAPATDLLWLCSVAKRHFQRVHKERNFVVVGDRILFEANETEVFDSSGEPQSDLPRGVIQHAFVRSSQISRKDPLHQEWEHVMLANVDAIAVVASVLNPEVRWGLIDRLLVQAELQNIRPAIVLNKVDLLQTTPNLPSHFKEHYEHRLQIYRLCGYDVYEVSALKPKKTLPEIKRLQSFFKGKLIGFCGHSGVGKSSILNLMNPEFEQIIDDNNDIFYKGRHTTTYNSLLKLGIGGYAIDTPGVRSFHIRELDPFTLSQCFPEFRNIVCKYGACSHHLEESCGIKAALAAGTISRERYRSYLGILKGLSFREGESQEEDFEMIADLKARKQHLEES